MHRLRSSIWNKWRDHRGALLALALAMLVSAAFGLEHIHDLRTLTPYESDFRIEEAILLKGGRWALMSVREERGLDRVWAVDLVNGRRKQIGPEGASAEVGSPFGYHVAPAHVHRFRLGVSCFEGTLQDFNWPMASWFDGATGEILATKPWPTLARDIRSIMDDDVRDISRLRGADDSRAWISYAPKDGKGAFWYVVEAANGSRVRHPLPFGSAYETPWGWVVRLVEAVSTVEPFAHRTTTLARSLEHPLGRFAIVAAPTPERILVQSGLRLHWVEMRSGESTEHSIPGVEAIGKPERCADGRVRMLAYRHGTRVVLVVDPSTAKIAVYPHSYHTTSGPRLPDGRLFAFNDRLGRMEIYDERSSTVEPLGTESLWPIGDVHGASLLAVQGDRRIVRYHPATGNTERVWPR